MGIVLTVIDALRRSGSQTQRTAIERQDEQLKGKRVIGRRRHVPRSELGQSATFVATTEPEPETVAPLSIQGSAKDFRGFPYHAISKRIGSGEYGFFKPIYISLQDAAEREWKPVDAAEQALAADPRKP